MGPGKEPPTAAAEAQAAEAKSKPTEAPKAALTRTEIVKKLNAVPTFALLNPSKDVVSICDDKGTEACCWYTDPREAQAMLAIAQQMNPEVALHLGVTPLGLAFAICSGWMESGFEGELRLQGSTDMLDSMGPMLQQQLDPMHGDGDTA